MIWHAVIPGDPRTKKNSQRIITTKTGKRIPLPSKAYEQYQEQCGWCICIPDRPIDIPVNVRCVYYMGTRRKVDLCNLLEATCDILVHYRVLADDNSSIVASHDGSCVRYDKANPRVEIEIEEVGRWTQSQAPHGARAIHT